MRNRVVIVVSVALMLVVLAVLNAASYVRLESQSDSEFAPDRSTLNAGATGTRALYDYLQESGHTVVRWRKSPAALLGQNLIAPSTFVVVGGLRRQYEEEEALSLLRWVGRGGRLVVIDRAPDPELLPASQGWRVTSEIAETPDFDLKADDEEAMTRGVAPVAPAQPLLLTRDVEQVMRSRFASRLHVFPPGGDTTSHEESDAKISGSASDGSNANANTNTNVNAGAPREQEETESEEPYGPPVVVEDKDAPAWNPWATPTPPPPPPEPAREPQSPAPVVLLPDGREGRGALLVEYAYRRGRISVLSDPYVVSNRGLARADNLQLAVNLLTEAGGPIAFDEFHHGRGETENMTLAYFKGTPVLAMLAQLAAVALAVLWTRGRRFARPLPAPHADRRSNLEFVASMAELQQRARAHDLAIENVYARTRRVLARYGGSAANAPYEEVAARVGARSGRDARPLAALMRECEEAIAGERINGRRALELVAALRQWERELGIRLRAREIRQLRSL